MVTTRDTQGEMQQTPASAHWYQQSLAALQKAAAGLSIAPAVRKTGQPNAAVSVNESIIYDEMGQTWLRLGNPVAAVEAFRHARRANPTRADIFLRLGYALVATGQPAEAARSYWQALFIATNPAPVKAALTAVYTQLPDRLCLPFRPDCPLVHQDICAAHAEMVQLLVDAGQDEFARKTREHAVYDFHCPP